MDVLRKLHNSNVNVSTSDMLAQHPINAQEAAPARDSPANSALKQALHVHEKKDSTPGKKSLPEPAAQKTPASSAQKTPASSAKKTPALSAQTTSASAQKTPVSSQKTPTSSAQETPVSQKSTPSTRSQKSTPVTAAPNPPLIRLASRQSLTAPSPATPEPSVPDKKPIKIKLRLPAGSLNATNVFSAVQLSGVHQSPANVVPVGL